MMREYSEADFDIRSLGCFYTPEKTVFRIFAPDYGRMDLVIGPHSYEMHKKGLCFEIAFSGDLELRRYHYESDNVRFKDPFSYLSINDESLVLNEKKFISARIVPHEYQSPIIYECSVRDFSSDPSFPGSYRKKFLAFTQRGLKSEEGESVGLDYLRQLGITHLQLLPVFDFDDDKGEYNWGYNPVAYNYVKSAYVNDVNDPYAFINELRHTVNVLHENDIRVVLDVVFNHVYRYRFFDLGKMLAGRLYRHKADGTLAMGTMCGNEIKSEDPFVRAYIVEMIERYLHLFDIDGVRMDLMGISDYETVNLIYQPLSAKKKDFLVYGEGWNMGDALDESERASINNVEKMPHIYMFNDHFRETIIHYVSGNDMIEEEVCKVLGGDEEYLDAYHSLNYVECHDDYTFFDRMMIFKSEDHDHIIGRRARLAMALVMIAKGIPFIHAGQEFFRTKKGIRNSYNSPDEINAIDWARKDRNLSTCEYLRDLIQIRKLYPSFSDPEDRYIFEHRGGCLICRNSQLVIYINQDDSEVLLENENIAAVVFDGQRKCFKDTSTVSVPPFCVVICQS
jgi:pullulanase